MPFNKFGDCMGKIIPTIIGIILLVGLPFILNYVGIDLTSRLALAIIIIVPSAVAGLLARSGGDSAISGFLTMFIPMLGMGILMIINALGFLQGTVSSIIEAIATALVGTILLIVGLVVIIASVIVSIIGAIIGGISGFVSRVLFPKK